MQQRKLVVSASESQKAYIYWQCQKQTTDFPAFLNIHTFTTKNKVDDRTHAHAKIKKKKIWNQPNEKINLLTFLPGQLVRELAIIVFSVYFCYV